MNGEDRKPPSNGTRAQRSTEHVGRVVVIWDGAVGVGLQIGQRLAEVGARVTLVSGDPLIAEGPLTDEPNPVVMLSADTSHEDGAARAMAEVVRRHGRLDYLVCCTPEPVSRPFLELTAEEWDVAVTEHLTGVFVSCREALRTMRPQGAGRILVMSSLVARTGASGGAAFAASAGGVLGLARSLASEVAADGVRVNTLSPADRLSGGAAAAVERPFPLGRDIRTDDVVEAALFLLGDESSYLVGQDLRVTGGVGLW